MSDDNKSQMEKAEQISNMVNQQIATLVCMSLAQFSNRGASSYVAVNAVSTAMTVASLVLGKKPKDEDISHVAAQVMNPTARMMAAMLAVAATKGEVEISDANELAGTAGVHFNWGASTFVEAMDMVEQITGHKPDVYLDQNMVRQIREWQKENTDKAMASADTAMQRFMESRKKS